MRYFRLGPGLKARLFLFSAAAFLASGGIGAQASTSTCVAPTVQGQVTCYIVIQPVDVCDTSGPSGPTGCAPFNTLSPSPDPSTATATTPIGFVDSATNVNVTRAIWLQTGIDVTFLPMAEYNNTNFEIINDIVCTDSSCTTLSSSLFQLLLSGPKATGCKSHCSLPSVTRANATYMFFVNSLSGTAGSLFGFATLNGNGSAIASDVFFPGPPRLGTLAHELGHNLKLDHATYGAGFVDNVMTGGTTRTEPSSSGCSSTGGALFELDKPAIINCPGLPMPLADQLTLGSNTDASTCCQQGEAFLSSFLNPIPNVNATAGGGGGFAAARTNSSSSGSGIPFTITNNGGGRPGQFVDHVIFALAPGLDFQGNTPARQTSSGSVNIISQERVNGNLGTGNQNCDKQVGLAPPSIHCLQIDFTHGAFVAGQSITFTLKIIENDVPLTVNQLTDLAGTGFTTVLETDQTTTTGTVPIELFATSSRFKTVDSFLQPANSTFPDAATASVILNTGGTFVGSTQTPCTLSGDTTMCPPVGFGGNGIDPLD